MKRLQQLGWIWVAVILAALLADAIWQLQRARGEVEELRATCGGR